MAGPVQGTKGTATGAGSMTLTLPGPCTAGNLLASSMQTPNTTGGTVSDTVNGSYSVGLNHSTANGADDLAMFFHASIGSGTPTLTITPGGAGNIGATVEEYNGPLTSSPLDVTGATEVTAQTSITTNSLTTTGANGDLLVATISTQTKSTTLSNSTAGWSINQNNTPNATEDAVIAARVQSTAGAFTTTFTTSGAAMDMCVVVCTFKLQVQTPATAPYASAFPLLSGFEGPIPPFTPTLGIQSIFLQNSNPPLIPVVAANPAPITIFGVLRRPLRPPREQFVVAGAPPIAQPGVILVSPQKKPLQLRRGSARVAAPGPASPAPTTLLSPLKPRLRLKQGNARIAGAASQAATPLILRSPLKPTLRIRRGAVLVAGTPQPASAPIVLLSKLKARMLARRGSGLELAPPIPTTPPLVQGVARKLLSLRRSRAQVAAIFVSPPIIPPVTMPRQPSRLNRVRRVQPQLQIPGFAGIGPSPPSSGFFWRWTPKSTDLS